MIKAICFILLTVSFGAANQIVINTYPYQNDSCSLSCSLSVRDTVTFSNGISFWISWSGLYAIGYNEYSWELEFKNKSYISLGYKDTINSDTSWTASIFMPANLAPLNTVPSDDSSHGIIYSEKYSGIFIATEYMDGHTVPCSVLHPYICNAIIYANSKDYSNMKFQINRINKRCNLGLSINILFAIDSLGNGIFSNNPTKLINHNINKLQRINSQPLYFDLKGSLHKKEMLKKFRRIIKKSS